MFFRKKCGSQDEFFNKYPPKSLDRNYFNDDLKAILQLDIKDALASICFIIAKQVFIALEIIDSKIVAFEKSSNLPKKLIICGGGRHNKVILDNIKRLNSQKLNSQIEILISEDENINGDFIEANLFAFLALKKLANKMV